jgi:hypothetical protein
MRKMAATVLGIFLAAGTSMGGDEFGRPKKFPRPGIGVPRIQKREGKSWVCPHRYTASEGTRIANCGHSWGAPGDKDLVKVTLYTCTICKDWYTEDEWTHLYTTWTKSRRK